MCWCLELRGLIGLTGFRLIGLAVQGVRVKEIGLSVWFRGRGLGS